MIFQDDGTVAGIERAERTERLAKFALYEVVGCELSPREITENLEKLMEGRATIHGREEIST
jgi:hypothetical protein